MTGSNGKPHRSEKGLLTPDNCMVAIIDLQPQMVFGVASTDRQSLLNSTTVLAKAARVFGVPVVLTTVDTRGFSGFLSPQIQAVFPGQGSIERTTMNAWDHPEFVAAVEQTGRRKLVLAGLWTGVCIAQPAIQALQDGYEIFIVEDCCGDVSPLSQDNAMRRMELAGAKPVTALSVLLEWQRDWAARDTYDAVLDIIRTHGGAYGAGVEYAYTMVHGAPRTALAPYLVPGPEYAVRS